MTYKGDSVSIICCGEPMKALGQWPHNQTEILVSRFQCLKCRNNIKIIEPGSKIIWDDTGGKEVAA